MWLMTFSFWMGTKIAMLLGDTLLLVRHCWKLLVTRRERQETGANRECNRERQQEHHLREEERRSIACNWDITEDEFFKKRNAIYEDDERIRFFNVSYKILRSDMSFI